MTDRDTPHAQVLDQRVRNRIIECLEMICAPEESATLDPDSIVNLWADWVRDPIEVECPSPVYTAEEREAVIRVNTQIGLDAFSAGDATGGGTTSSAWSALRAVAREALQVFAQRGRLSEDRVAT